MTCILATPIVFWLKGKLTFWIKAIKVLQLNTLSHIQFRLYNKLWVKYYFTTIQYNMTIYFYNWKNHFVTFFQNNFAQSGTNLCFRLTATKVFSRLVYDSKRWIDETKLYYLNSTISKDFMHFNKISGNFVSLTKKIQIFNINFSDNNT